jgi:hypothetical protein
MGQERFSASLKPSDAMCPYVPAGRSRQNSKPPMKLAPHYHLMGHAKAQLKRRKLRSDITQA